MGCTPQPLDSDVIAQACHDDLAVACFLRGLHCQQVAVQNSYIAHRHAAHLEQIVRFLFKQAALDAVGVGNVCLRENG